MANKELRAHTHPLYGEGVTGRTKTSAASKWRSCKGDGNELNGQCIAAEDEVGIRFKTRALHTGELFGVPPSGRTITMTGMEMYRLSGDKIAELWGKYNVSELFSR